MVFKGKNNFFSVFLKALPITVKSIIVSDFIDRVRMVIQFRQSRRRSTMLLVDKLAIFV